MISDQRHETVERGEKVFGRPLDLFGIRCVGPLGWLNAGSGFDMSLLSQFSSYLLLCSSVAINTSLGLEVFTPLSLQRFLSSVVAYSVAFGIARHPNPAALQASTAWHQTSLLSSSEYV